MDTVYSTRMGGNTPQSVTQNGWINPFAQRPAPRTPSMQDAYTYLQSPQARQAYQAPAQPQMVNGSDISNGPAPLEPDQIAQAAHRVRNPLAGIDIGAPEQAQENPDLSTEQGLGAAGLLPVTPPKMPSDPTNGVKKLTPEHVEAGQQGVNLMFQTQQPNNPIQSATQQQDQQRINNDLAQVAGASDPKKAWQELKKDPFYKDSTFYSGVMATGLAIMSGANPLQAFQAGQGQMQQADVKQQLQGNRDYLLQNYTGDSVANAIAKGDPSLLKQKQMSEEDRMAAENQVWSQRNQAANQEWDRRQAIESQNQLQQQAASDQRYQQRMDETEARQKRMVDYRAQQKLQQQQQAAGDAASGFTFSSKDISNEQRPYADTFKQHNYKQQQFGQAREALNGAIEAAKRGDDQAARAYYQQYANYAMRGEAGSTRSINAEDSKLVEDPSILVRKGNEYSIASGFSPTLKTLQYADKNLGMAQGAEEKTMSSMKAKRIRNLVDSNPGKWTKEKATAFINQSWGVVGDNADPYNLYAQQEERQGGLSMGDTSWMLQ